MTKITIAEVARQAISDYRINSGDKEALQGRISKRIRRFIDENHGKNTPLTKEIAEEINSWQGLIPYFKDQASRNWKGKEHYEDLAKKIEDNIHKAYFDRGYIDKDPLEYEMQKEIDNDIKSVRNRLRDNLMLTAFFYLNNDSYKEDYKIIVQNNFSKSLLEFAKDSFFDKYFDSGKFHDESTKYALVQIDLVNHITPEMAEAFDHLEDKHNYKYYLKN